MWRRQHAQALLRRLLRSGEDRGYVSSSVGRRRSGLLRFCAGGEEGKGGAFAGTVALFGPSPPKVRLRRAKGGDGGNGCISFRRSRSDRQGKPDGT